MAKSPSPYYYDSHLPLTAADEKRPLSAFEARKVRQAARSATRNGHSQQVAAKANGEEDDSNIEQSITIAPIHSSKRRPQELFQKPRKRARAQSPPETAVSPVVITSAVRPDQPASLPTNGTNTNPEASAGYDSESSSSDDALKEGNAVLGGETVPPDQVLTTIASEGQITDEPSGTIRVVLRPNEEITFIGSYVVWVRKGCVAVMGALIGPSPRVVFAPSTHALPAIRHVRLPNYADQEAEVVVESIRTGLRGLGRLNPSFKSIWNQREQDESGKSFAYLPKSSSDPKGRTLTLLEEPTEWLAVASAVIEKANTNPTIFICGPKNSGKSSFARYLLNRLLTYPQATDSKKKGVAWLDLDPGQPEYSPPGDVSLITITEPNLGPSFSHPFTAKHRVKKAHHIGDDSPAYDVRHYLACAKDLVFHHKRTRPLIVNTCGWMVGTGIEVVDKLLEYQRPTDIVMLSNSEQSTPGIAQLEAVARKSQKGFNSAIHRLPCQKYASRPARDLRLMQALSYFHSEPPFYKQPCWNGAPLCDQKSHPLRYSGNQPDIHSICVYGSPIDPELLHTAINGSVCALVSIDDVSLRKAVVSTAPNGSLPYLSLDTPFPPSKTRLVGQVIVRGIDTTAHTIYVLYPTAFHDTLAGALLEGQPPLVLVRGRSAGAGWACTEDFYNKQVRISYKAAWEAFRHADITKRGGKITKDGIFGPNGEDWTNEEPLDFPVEGESEFSDPAMLNGHFDSVTWAANQPLVNVVPKTNGTKEAGNAAADAPRAGLRLRRLRRYQKETNENGNTDAAEDAATKAERAWSAGDRPWKVRRNLGKPVKT